MRPAARSASKGCWRLALAGAAGCSDNTSVAARIPLSPSSPGQLARLPQHPPALRRLPSPAPRPRQSRRAHPGPGERAGDAAAAAEIRPRTLPRPVAARAARHRATRRGVDPARLDRGAGAQRPQRRGGRRGRLARAAADPGRETAAAVRCHPSRRRRCLDASGLVCRRIAALRGQLQPLRQDARPDRAGGHHLSPPAAVDSVVRRVRRGVPAGHNARRVEGLPARAVGATDEQLPGGRPDQHGRHGFLHPYRVPTAAAASASPTRSPMLPACGYAVTACR